MVSRNREWRNNFLTLSQLLLELLIFMENKIMRYARYMENLKINIFVILSLMLSWAGLAPRNILVSESVKNAGITLEYILVFVAMALIVFSQRIIFNYMNILAIASVVIFWFLQITSNYNVRGINGVMFLMLVTFLFLDRYSMNEVYKKYRNIMILVSAFGIIAYINAIIQLLPIEVYPYYEGQGGAVYLVMGPIYVYANVETGIRLCGIFNEPGYLGTVLALILCVEKYNLRNKGNVVMLVASICTMSFAFYLISFLYLFLKNIGNIKKMMIGVASIVTVLAIFNLFPLLGNVGEISPEFEQLISRFSITDNGKFSGDNRTDIYIDEAFDKIFYSEKVLYGNGGGYARSIASKGVLSIVVMIVDYGFVGIIISYGTLLLSALFFNKLTVSSLAYILVFFISTYQRPDIFWLNYFVLLFGGLVRINSMEMGNEE